MLIEEKANTDWVNGNSGFTFIEIVIALCVFSIGILGVTMMQTTAISGNATAMNNTSAVAVASGQMEKVLGTSYLTLSEGTTTEGPYTVRWEVEAPVNNKRNVHVIVEWKDKGSQRSITFDMIRNASI